MTTPYQEKVTQIPKDLKTPTCGYLSWIMLGDPLFYIDLVNKNEARK
jgi:hypothetical protein